MWRRRSRKNRWKSMSDTGLWWLVQLGQDFSMGIKQITWTSQTCSVKRSDCSGYSRGSYLGQLQQPHKTPPHLVKYSSTDIAPSDLVSAWWNMINFMQIWCNFQFFQWYLLRVIHSDSPMHQGWLQELRGKLQGDLKGRSEDELATWMSQMSGLSS